MHEIGQNYYYTLSHMTKAYRLQLDDDSTIEWCIVREQITKSLVLESNLGTCVEINVPSPAH